MAHWTVTVSNVAGARDLERVFAAFARAGLPIQSGRIERGAAHLVLPPGTPTRMLQEELERLGFSVTAEPGDHLREALSTRERELMGHLATGLQLKEAARQMGVGISTAREYWLRVKRKWGVRTIGQAVSAWSREVHAGSHDH